jgi:hypothetical protein
MLEERSGQEFDAEALLPNTEARRYLQSQYTINAADFIALSVIDAGDGSSWSTAHARHHPFFQGLIGELQYEDVLSLNTTGEVAYSAYKGVDLGVNVLAAPYTDSALTNAKPSALPLTRANVQGFHASQRPMSQSSC